MNLADLAEMARRGMPPTHAQLLAMRNALPGDSPDQVPLAGQEHQAFAREWTQENPMLALPSLLFAIPGYSAAKAAGLIHSRTPASPRRDGFGVPRDGRRNLESDRSESTIAV